MTEQQDSVYNDAAFNITSVPSWKNPPLHGAFAANAKFSPRAKAAIGVAGVVLAATGMFAWSDYATASADAEVRRAQIALEVSKVDLESQKQLLAQQAEQARTVGQESDVQKARRVAVQACVAKAGGSYNAISDCGKAFPITDTAGMSNTASSVPIGAKDSSTSPVGLVVIGAVGSIVAVGWAKKRFARS